MDNTLQVLPNVSVLYKRFGTKSTSYFKYKRKIQLKTLQEPALLSGPKRHLPGVVSEPDAEVLDLEWLAFADGLNADDLAGGLLELPELTQKVPKSEIQKHNKLA